MNPLRVGRRGVQRRAPVSSERPVGLHPIAPARLPPPALDVLDAGHRLVQRLQVEALVDLDRLAGDRLHPVDHQVQMRIVGVGVQAVKHLVAGQPQLVQENVHGLLDLRRRRLFARWPAQHVVVDRVFAVR